MATTYYYGVDKSGKPVYESSTYSGTANTSQAVIAPGAPNSVAQSAPNDVKSNTGGVYLSARDSQGNQIQPSTFYAYGGPNFTTSPITSSALSTQNSINLPAPNYVSGGFGALSSAMAGTGLIPVKGADGVVTYRKPTPQELGQPNDPSLPNYLGLADYATKQLANIERPNKQQIYQEEAQKVQLQQKEQEVQNYTNQLNAITANAQAEKLSLIGQGRGITTSIISNQQGEIDRKAAIQALPIAAQLAAAQGNLKLAQDHLDKMYQMRVEDAMNEYNYKMDVFKTVMPFLTKQEEARAQQVMDKEKAKTELDMYKAKLDYEQYIKNLNPTYSTFGSADTGYYRMNDRTGETVPVAGGGSGGTKPLNILDVARYNELYPDAGITPSDTQESANAKVTASQSPDAKLRLQIKGFMDSGATYKKVVSDIKTSSSIADKTTALKIADEVYGMSSTSNTASATSPIEQEIARLQKDGILTNADIRSALLKRYPPQDVANSSVGSWLDQLGSFLFGK